MGAIYLLILGVLLTVAALFGVIFVPAIRDAVIDILDFIFTHIQLFFDWLRFDVFKVKVPAGYTRAKTKLKAMNTKFIWWLRGAFVIIALLLVITVVALLNGSSTTVSVIMLILAGLLCLVFFPLNGTKLFFGFKPARTLAMIILALIMGAIIHLTAPVMLGSVWGHIVYSLMLLSFAIYLVTTLMGTSSNIPHWIMVAVMSLIIIGASLVVIFPEDVRGMTASKAESDKNKGIINAQTELKAYNTFGTVEKEAISWKLTFNSEGQVIAKEPWKDENGQFKKLSVGNNFRFSDERVSTVNAQGTYVSFLRPIEEGGDEYPLPKADPNEREYIDVSKVKIKGENENKITKDKDKDDLIKGQVSIAANQKWFDTGIDIPDGKKVNIRVVGGQWRNHPSSGWNAGEGRSPYKEQNLLIVPSAKLSSLVAKSGEGKGIFVGNDYKGELTPGRLYLSINDKEGYFDDNEGSLQVVISFLD